MPSELPTVSIGMPVFNGGRFLGEALESLAAQRYKDFELIVSDNASSDATQDICREYLERFDGRMRYVRHAVNHGPMANFRYVFEAAQGQYFAWAACDDLWDDGWLEKLVRLMETSVADIAFGKVVIIDSAGKTIKHPATNASFSYQGPVLLRRLGFFIEDERFGKANILYALFGRRMFPAMSRALKDCEAGAMRYDYSIVYKLLEAGELATDKSAVMKKRYHQHSLGEDMTRQRSTRSLATKSIRAMLNPFPDGLIAEYFSYSSRWERMLLALCLPVKMLLAYRGQVISFCQRQHA